MLISFSELLDEAMHSRTAVGAFTAYNSETADAVLRAAERRRCGVILLVSSQTFALPVGFTLASALLGIAERTPVPCCLQLDHEKDVDRITRALELGFGAVMADGSQLPLSENIAFVRHVVSLAESHGAQVEAELGHVAGDEEIAAAAARGAFTDPDEAAAFLQATGAACLAVSIGNVHGRYSEAPRLDWQRLAALREAVPVPLSLHGGSGIPDAMIRRAVREGIAKINVNTELRDRYFRVLEERVSELAVGSQLLNLSVELSAGMRTVADAKLERFGH